MELASLVRLLCYSSTAPRNFFFFSFFPSFSGYYAREAKQSKVGGKAGGRRVKTWKKRKKEEESKEKESWMVKEHVLYVSVQILRFFFPKIPFDFRLLTFLFGSGIVSSLTQKSKKDRFGVSSPQHDGSRLLCYQP